MTEVAKLLTLTRLGSSSRTYRFWSRQGALSFEGVNWRGTDSSQGSIQSIGQISYSINETAKELGCRMLSEDATLIDDMAWGSSLSEGIVGLIYYTGGAWKRCPVKYRGLIGNVVKDGRALSFSLSTFDVDRDRIRPGIWSHQSQLRQYPNDQGFRFLNFLVASRNIQFLQPISSRE